MVGEREVIERERHDEDGYQLYQVIAERFSEPFYNDHRQEEINNHIDIDVADEDVSCK